MTMYYFDASALVKYYVPEPGSAWVRQLLDAREPARAQALHLIFVAEITRVEVAAGLAVIERIGRIRRAERTREYQRFTSHLTHRRHEIFRKISQKGPLAGGYRRVRDRRECGENRGIITGALCREITISGGGARPSAWRLTGIPLWLLGVG